MTEVHAGGLAPYHVEVEVLSTNGSQVPILRSSAPNGPATLGLPGRFLVTVTVADATCARWSSGYECVPAEAKGAGTDPLSSANGSMIRGSIA